MRDRKTFNSKLKLFLLPLSILVAFSYIFVWIIKRHKLNRSEGKNKNPPFLARSLPLHVKKRRKGYLFGHLAFAALFLGAGWYLSTSTLPPKEFWDESNYQFPYFNVFANYDVKSLTYLEQDNASLPILEPTSDYIFNISIEILEDSQDAFVQIWTTSQPDFVVETDKNGFPIAFRHTNSIKPSFTVWWPGHIRLTERFHTFTLSHEYELHEHDDYTEIKANFPGTMSIEFLWLNAVETRGLFQKRLFLPVGERPKPSLDLSQEPKYKVQIHPELPMNSRILKQEPATLESVVKNELPNSGYEIMVIREDVGFYDPIWTDFSQSNFELIYESSSSDGMRNLMLIVAGIAFALAANFLTTIMSETLIKSRGGGQVSRLRRRF